MKRNAEKRAVHEEARTAAEEADQSISDALQQTLDEARMVLPGIQALFGFQLIVVFNEGFDLRLSGVEQMLHLAAIVLVTAAIALVMTPAAYHRQVLPRQASSSFLLLASRFISAAMVPLAAGLAIDVYLVAKVITDQGAFSAVLALGIFAALAMLWFGYPQWRASARHRQAAD